MGGFEPPRTEPESAVLPLDDIPAGTFFCGWLGREDSNPRMAGPKPAALPLGDCPLHTISIWRRGRDSNPGWAFDPHTLSRRAPSASSVTSPAEFFFGWRRMRDSNPHGQNPAVFKTAALPIRTNPPWRLNPETCWPLFCQGVSAFRFIYRQLNRDMRCK